MGEVLYVCTKCGESKARSEYYDEKIVSDGRKKRCKACVAAQQRTYKAKVSAKVKANDKLLDMLVDGKNPVEVLNGLTVGDVDAKGTEADVVKDIVRRQKAGIAKYGTTVEDNPLPIQEWFQQAYEEALDLSIYLKQIINLWARLDAAIEEDKRNERG